MTLEGLTDRYLERLLLPLNKHFAGVYPCNKIPLFPYSEKVCLIINLSKANEKGSHFIAISNVNDQLLYFDPFGLPCDNEFIQSYMKRYSSHYTYNTQTVQHVTSYFCGYFCAYFCLQQRQNFSFGKFLRLFSSDCVKNDAIVEKLISEYISNA